MINLVYSQLTSVLFFNYSSFSLILSTKNMQPSEIKEDENINRRGSLAISALLNDSSAAAAGDSVGGGGSPILTSGTVSPVMGNATTANQLSKAKRKRISPAQYNRLMEIFDQTDTPSSEIRENLAEELDMTKREVQVKSSWPYYIKSPMVINFKFLLLGLVSKS
jgi:hypothetical protein